MDQLRTAINELLQEYEQKLSISTYESRRRYFRQLTRLADEHGYDKPCQELFNLFIKDDHESKERHSMHLHIIKELDAHCKIDAVSENGLPFNNSKGPSSDEAASFFSLKKFPVEECPVDYLIVLATTEMEPAHHSISTMGQYKRAWRRFRQYCETENDGMFTAEICRQYIDLVQQSFQAGSLNLWRYKIYRKAALVLNQVAQTGIYHWCKDTDSKICLPDDVEKIRQEYLNTLITSGLSRKTLNLNDYVFRRLCQFCNINSLDELGRLEPEIIQKGIIEFSRSCVPNSMSTILPIIRRILQYIANKYHLHDYSPMIMNTYHSYGIPIPYINSNDEKKLIIQLEKESLRDKAIILTSLRLGLRESDICNLKLSDIDWNNDRISIVQKKTGIPLVLPLVPEVGNAILNYLINERPRSSGCPYVFLRKQAPFHEMSSVYLLFSKIMHKAEVHPENRSSFGSHLLRYTVVHSLLKAMVPHQVITDALGHTSSESDKAYITLEEDMLRKCALDCSDIGVISWKAAI